MSIQQMILAGGGGGIPSLIDNDLVSTWIDSSTSANNATQTGSARPTFKTNQINGKPIVRFTAANSTKMNLSSLISGDFQWTVLAVIKPATSSTNIHGLAGTDSARPHASILNAGPYTIMIDRWGYRLFNGVQTGWHIIAASTYATGGNTNLRLDGTAVSTTSAAQANTGDFSSIGYATDDGDVAEVLIYRPGLVNPNLLNVQTYLSVKYGITITGGGTVVAPNSVAGLVGWWKADALDATPSPPVITGLKAWWKADSLGLVDGVSVGAANPWTDVSGNGYNLTAGTSTYKTSIVNGKPVVRFDGVANRVYTGVNSAISQPNTIFVVGKQTSKAVQCYFFYSSGIQLMGLDTSGFLTCYSGTGKTGSVDRSGAFHCFTMVVSGGNVTGYTDGTVDVPTAADGANGVQTVNFMSTSTGTAPFGVGDIAEVMIYNTALSSTDRQAVENYLKAKYATP